MGIVINNPSSATGNNRNYIINSDFKVAQAATSATITAGNAIPTASLGYPVLDCWFAYSVGANSTLSQEGNLSAKRLQIQTNAGTTAMGIGQRIEFADAGNLATKTVTLSFECSHNNLTSLTITASRPTTSADTFGTIASPTKTQIATTTITITNTLTRYSWTFTCPQEVERGLEILFTFGSNASSGTFQLANVKLEEGSLATTFIPTIYAEELNKCQRYFSIIPTSAYGYPSPSTGGYAFNQLYPFPCAMRIAPVVNKTYTGQVNVTRINLQNITPYFFIDQIVSTAAGNTNWQLAATCSAYIP